MLRESLESVLRRGPLSLQTSVYEKWKKFPASWYIKWRLQKTFVDQM
jgi:hypothetical protein